MARLSPSMRGRGLTIALLISTCRIAAGADCLPPAVCSQSDLVTAINTANAAGSGTITLGANITLSADLPSIAANVTIDGGGYTLSGASRYRGFVVGDMTANLDASPYVTIKNLTIQDTVGTGGSGGSGPGIGGGGGAGLGGAIFVAAGSDVTLTRVSIVNSTAVGGRGGGTDGTDASRGSSISPTVPGSFGWGTSGADGVGGQGGGATALIMPSAFPGTYTDFAGGAGGSSGGGGGAALGGAIFVQGDPWGSGWGTLTIGDGVSINGSAVTAGRGGTGAGDGGAFGAGIYLHSGYGFLTFSPETATTTISDSIVDVVGASGGDASLVGFWTLVKTGEGTLVLGGDNRYSDGTDVRAGTLRVASNSNLGTTEAEIHNCFGSCPAPYLSLRGSSTLEITGSNTFDRYLDLHDSPTIRVLPGVTANWSGEISDWGQSSLNVTGGGSLALSHVNNTYSRGTIVTGGSTVSISNDGALGFQGRGGGGGVTLGNTSSSGTLAITGNPAFSSSRLFTLGAGGGVINTDATTNALLSGAVSGAGGLTKSGAGTLTLTGVNTYAGATTVLGGTLSAGGFDAFGSTPSVAIGPNGTVDFGIYSYSLAGLSGTGTILFGSGAALTLGANNTNVTFGGTIDGGGRIVKAGAGTLTLSGSNAYSGGTSITAGTVSISSGANLGSGSLTMNDGATLAITGSGTYANNTSLSGTATFRVSPSATATWSGAISDYFSSLFGDVGSFPGSVIPGGLNVTGGGTLVLANAANLYSLGTTVSGGSTVGVTADGALGATGTALTLGDASSTGTLAITTAGSFSSSRPLTLGAGGGTISTAPTAAATLAGLIGGAGGLTKDGAGSLTLAGVNTYAGATSVNAGTLFAGATNAFGSSPSLTIGAAGTVDFAGFNQALNKISGTGTLSLGGGATLAVGANNTDNVFGGAIIGTGAISKHGTGTLTLSGSNSYTGGTTVNGGTLIGTTTSLQGRIVNNGAVVFDQPFAGTYAGVMSGSGSLTKNGSGTLTLAGTNTYSGSTFANAGTLRAGSSNAFGAGALNIARGATVDLNGFSQNVAAVSGSGALSLGGGANLSVGGGTFGGALTGSGGLVKNGIGTLVLTGANSYSGGTVVNAGTLVGNTVSLQGNIFNSAKVLFDQPASGTYAGSMTGSGVLEKTGAGTLTLTATNSYTGGTLISAGTVVGDSASLQGTIVNNGSLVFNHSGPGTFSGTILGTGTVSKHGDGELSIAGANPFSGALWVNQGSIALNGAFAGDVHVVPAAHMHGAGVIGGSFTLGGTLFVAAPGTSAASFNATRLGLAPAQTAGAPSFVINGDLIATPGSVLDFTVTPGGAPPLIVNGLASLTGTRVNVAVNDPNPARYATYVGLSSAGLTVTDVESSSATPGIVPVLKYGPQSIFVTLLNEVIPLGGIVSSPNAAGVGAALDRLKPNMTGDLAFVVRELTALDDQSLNDALKRLSGEVHSSELRLTADESWAMTELVRGAIDDRNNEADDSRDLTGAQSMRWWFQLTGDHARFTRVGFDNAVANAGGGGGGFDFRPFKRFIVGGGGSFTVADLSMLGHGGSSNMEAPRAFGYVGYSAGPFLLNGGGSTSRTTYKTTRPVVFNATVPGASGLEPLSSGIDREAESEQTGVTRDAWTEWKDTYKHGSWTYTSKVGYRAATYERNPFTETGAGSISLSGLSQVLNTKEADLTINAFRRTGRWRPRMFISYRRQLGELATSSTMQIGDLPAGQFVVEGVPLPQDEFHGIFGVTYRSAFGVEYTLEYEARRAKNENHDGLHFRVRFK